MTASPIKRRSLALMLLLASTGLVVAGYLAFLHYNFQAGRFITTVGCSGSGLFNCHLVALSRYAFFAGRPIAAWGAALYAIWIALAIVGLGGEAHHRLAVTRLIGASALAALCVDVYLAWLMLAKLHAVCLWCVLTYVINLCVLLVAWQALRRAGERLGKASDDLWLVCPLLPPRGPQVVPVLVAAWCLTALASVWGMTEVAERLTQGNIQQMRAQVRRYLEQRPPLQVATGGSPTHGVQPARLTIVEFSDFLCPACKTSSTTMKAVLANHAVTTRVIFKHYPLDTDCNPHVQRQVHPNACRIAAAASCAHAQGKFWELHDRIYARAPDYQVAWLEEDARRAGLDLPRWNACVEDGSGLAAVTRDIEEAHRLNVSSTPTFFINGYLFGGAIPPAAFEVIAQEFLKPSHRE